MIMKTDLSKLALCEKALNSSEEELPEPDTVEYQMIQQEMWSYFNDIYDHGLAEVTEDIRLCDNKCAETCGSGTGWLLMDDDGSNIVIDDETGIMKVIYKLFFTG